MFLPTMAAPATLSRAPSINPTTLQPSEQLQIQHQIQQHQLQQQKQKQKQQQQRTDYLNSDASSSSQQLRRSQSLSEFGIDSSSNLSTISSLSLQSTPSPSPPRAIAIPPTTWATTLPYFNYLPQVTQDLLLQTPPDLTSGELQVEPLFANYLGGLTSTTAQDPIAGLFSSPIVTRRQRDEEEGDEENEDEDDSYSDEEDETGGDCTNTEDGDGTGSKGLSETVGRSKKKGGSKTHKKSAAGAGAGSKNEVKRRDVFWDEMYQQLKTFKEANGHCIVPQKYPHLGGWVKRQRERRKKGQLSEDRAALLDQISFIWQIRGQTKDGSDEEDEDEETTADGLDDEGKSKRCSKKKGKKKGSKKKNTSLPSSPKESQTTNEGSTSPQIKPKDEQKQQTAQPQLSPTKPKSPSEDTSEEIAWLKKSLATPTLATKLFGEANSKYQQHPAPALLQHRKHSKPTSSEPKVSKTKGLPSKCLNDSKISKPHKIGKVSKNLTSSSSAVSNPHSHPHPLRKSTDKTSPQKKTAQYLRRPPISENSQPVSSLLLTPGSPDVYFLQPEYPTPVSAIPPSPTSPTSIPTTTTTTTISSSSTTTTTTTATTSLISSSSSSSVSSALRSLNSGVTVTAQMAHHSQPITIPFHLLSQQEPMAMSTGSPAPMTLSTPTAPSASSSIPVTTMTLSTSHLKEESDLTLQIEDASDSLNIFGFHDGFGDGDFNSGDNRPLSLDFGTPKSLDVSPAPSPSLPPRLHTHSTHSTQPSQPHPLSHTQYAHSRPIPISTTSSSPSIFPKRSNSPGLVFHPALSTSLEDPHNSARGGWDSGLFSCDVYDWLSVEESSLHSWI